MSPSPVTSWAQPDDDDGGTLVGLGVIVAGCQLFVMIPGHALEVEEAREQIERILVSALLRHDGPEDQPPT